MEEVVHTLMHILGFCGDSHPNLLNSFPAIEQLSNQKKAFAYTLSNTWQILKLRLK